MSVGKETTRRDAQAAQNSLWPEGFSPARGGTEIASHPRTYSGEDDMQIGVETTRAVENKRVFVVDSDEITRAALTFMLHDENETHELADLEAAYAKGADWKPDLLLLGLGILRRRGLGVLAEIAARLPGVKVLIVADTVADDFAQAALAAGAHGLLKRPFTVESVRQKVDRLLGRRVTLGIPVEVI
jgi:CheY-like chemotaxis protein